MATVAKQLNYPKKLTDHLKQFSVEKEDECKMYLEWLFSRTEDSGEAGSDCPCGKKGIRYLCYITNKHSRKQTFVGTSCVEFFDEDMKEVLNLTLGLITSGITATYKGRGSREKQSFEIHGNTLLVTKQSRLKALFENVPIHQKRHGKWEIQVFTSENGLEEGRRYKLRIKTSRWSQRYGTGISFYVIESKKMVDRCCTDHDD